MSRSSHLLRVMTWRRLMLVVHIALLNRADAHYVDTTGEVPAWAIESLNPELDKITFPDNTLDNHQPYYAKPEMVYPSPKWTWEVFTESNKVDFPVSPKIAPPTRLKNQSTFGILNSRHSFSNPKFAKEHSKTSDHNWSVEMTLNKQTYKIHRNQQFSASSPIPWKHGHSPPNAGAPKKSHVKPLHANSNFHHSFQDPIYSRHKEETPKVPFVFNNQRNVHRQERSKKSHNSEINLHEGISDTSPISKHEVQGYKNFQSSSVIKAENIPFPRTNFRSLGPRHVEGITRQADEAKTDRKRKRDVPLLDNAYQTIPSHDQLPWTYHDNLPQRVRKDHVNAGVPLGWDGNQAFGMNKFHDVQHAPRDNANKFLSPIIDIFVDEADYDYITSLVENNEGSYNTDQKHHVFEPPLTYHVEHVFGGGSTDSYKGGFGGGSTDSYKGGFGGGSTDSYKGGFGGGSTDSHKGGFGGGSTDSYKGRFGGGSTDSHKGGFKGGSTDSHKGGFGGGSTDSYKGGFGGGSTYSYKGGFGGGSTDSHKGGFGGGSTDSYKGGFGGGSTDSYEGGFGGGSTDSHKGGFGGGSTDSYKGGFGGGSTDSYEGGFGGGSTDSYKGGFGGGSTDSYKGGFGGGSTDSYKGGFGGGSTVSHKGEFGGGRKGSLTHFDSSSLDLDYNVQYDFGVSETQALKGDAAIVEHGSGYAGHSAHSFGQFGGGNIHGSSGHSNLGGELYSSGFPQKGGHRFGHSDKDGHKFPSGDTVIQFGGQGFGSGYNFDSGHQKGLGLGSKDPITQSVGHAFESGDEFHPSGGDYTFDSGDIVYFEQDYNSGGKKGHSTAGNKFEHSGRPNFSSGDPFVFSGQSNVDFKNKFSHSEMSKSSPRTKLTDSLRPGIDSTDEFSHIKGQGFGSEDKFTHSGGSNFGHEDGYIQPGKSSFIPEGQSFHSKRSNFGLPGDLFKFRNHEFSSTDGALHSGGFSAERGLSLSHHQGGQDIKDVLSLFRPIGHDFGPTDVDSKEITHETSKSVTSDTTFFDNTSSKLIKPTHLKIRPEVSFSRSKEGRLDYSHSGILDVSKRSVGGNFDGSQSLYVETSSGETVPSNFFDPTSVAIKEELPNTFFINPEKLELSNNDRPTFRDRNDFFSRANESAGLKPAHLFTPASYDHNSGFHEEKLGMHRNNLTFISPPKTLGTHSGEHSTEKEESTSPIPKGFETYVHLPPNTTPKNDDGLPKNDFVQPIESTLYDYTYLRRGEGIDQTVQRNVKPNTGVREHAITRIRSSADIEDEADDYYHADGEYSAPESDDAHLDETNKEFLPERSHAMYVRPEPDEEHRQQDGSDQLQPPSQDASDDIAYYDDKYNGDEQTMK